jgi:hypothetical protein
MLQSLYKYLIQYKQLYIPHTGLLAFEKNASVTHFGSKTIHAPLDVLTINQFAPATDNKNLTRYLAKTLKITEEQANDGLQKITTEIQNSLNEKQIFYWPHVGTIQKAPDDKLKFVQSSEIDYYQPPVHLEPLIKEGSIHNIKVGDTESTNVQMHEYYAQQETPKKEYWWIWALVLATGAALLILMYNQ